MTYDTKMMDIMKEIGCGDGFHIPVANEENRLLEKEIKELLEKKARLLLTDDSLDSTLQEHKNKKSNLLVQEAQNQNGPSWNLEKYNIQLMKKLIVANHQQYESEQHMLINAQRDNDNLCRDNKLAVKKFNELMEEQKFLENELTKNNEQISKMRETIEWGEETLLSWNKDLTKQNTDLNLLEAYNLGDNARFKELDLQRQYLQRDVIERESIVERELSQLLLVEREMEQTANLTRQAQRERNHLLKQWENATNFLNTNQKETQSVVDEINRVKEAARQVHENMSKNKQTYQDYLEVNEELGNENEETQKINNEMKLSIKKQLLDIEHVQCELLTAKKSLSLLDNTLANDRTKRRHMQDEISKWKTMIQQKEEEIEAAKDNLSKIKNKSMTTEEKLNELNTIYDNQKVTTAQLMFEKNKVLNMKFGVNNEIRQLQSKIDLLKNQLEQDRNEQTMLRKEEAKTKQSIMEKKELLYNMSFELETIRIKIAEAEGTVDIEETHSLQEKLKSFNAELSRVNEKKQELQRQLKSNEIETRRMTRWIEKSTADLETLRNRVKELNVLNEGGDKQIQLLKEQNQRLHMEEMMAKLKVEQMKKLTENECAKAYSLTQQREELVVDIEKRKGKLEILYAKVNSEKKILSEEKSAVKRKLDALVQYVEQRKIRYQLFSATMGSATGHGDGDDGDEGEKSSFLLSEHRIRLTREKLELQEENDKLDERVQKLEIEVQAMENTLQMLNASNNCYKTSLTSVNPTSEEYKDKVDLEDTYEKINSMWSQKKKTLKTLQNEILDLEAQYMARNGELESLINLRNIKESDLELAHKEANEQLMKLNRANNRIQLAIKKIHKASCNNDKRNMLDLIKRDIIVRLTKKIKNSVLEGLSEITVLHTGVSPTVKQYLSEKGLELPVMSSLMLNQFKPSCSFVDTSSISSNNSLKGYSDGNKKCSYSIVNVEPTSRINSRNSRSAVPTQFLNFSKPH